MSDKIKAKLLPLETLRGIAALVVAMLHFQIAKSFLNDNFLVKNGSLMVDLFLLLVVLLLLIIILIKFEVLLIY